MSKITNDDLTRSGIRCFTAVPIWQQMALKGFGRISKLDVILPKISVAPRWDKTIRPRPCSIRVSIVLAPICRGCESADRQIPADQYQGMDGRRSAHGCRTHAVATDQTDGQMNTVIPFSRPY